MLGLLLRSDLIQGSAARTWNCVANIANFLWYKLHNLRYPVMPRSRRRHHSRSRSRSHSHERDREPKRRRVDSPDSSHHRRSVSTGNSPEKNETQEIEKRRDEEVIENMSNNTTDTEDDDGNESKENNILPEETENEIAVNVNSNEKASPKSKYPRDELKNLEIVNTPKFNTIENEEAHTNNEEADITQSPDTSKETSIDNKEAKETSSDNKEEQIVTPRKTPNKEQKKANSAKKISKEEREKKRLEEKEMKDKLKQEKKEQKIKERQEKEEQKKRERLEKEEQKRLEKEEKEEQRRKEKEEKDEQRRKEREQKEIKRQQELEEKNKDKKKMQKEAAAFVNFFVPRKSAGAAELKKSEEINSSFMPFAVKTDMRLAPLIRINISENQKANLTIKMESQNETKLYLDEIKNDKKIIRKSSSTWPVEDNDDVILLEDIEIGECVEEQPTASKMRAKLLKFHENRRPAYFGTWRKKSKFINPRKPLALDKDLFDYEVDSDDEWEEEEPGESLRGSDDEEKENEDDYEVDNEFFVPHGYLSDEEVENEENMALTPETQKAKLKLLQLEFEQEMKSKTERIKPRLIGCFWENKLKPKVQDVVSKFLDERMMIVAAPIIIKKRDLNTSIKQNSLTKTGTPNRKVLNKELVPEFLRMVHGNTNNQIFLVSEFLNYISNNELDSNVSKLGLTSQLKQFAKWRRCPEEGVMFNKYCWYVNEDVRNQYNLNLNLPNKWSHSVTDQIEAKKKLSL